MKTDRKKNLFALWILAAALGSPAAHAANPVWTHVAGACAIDKNSLAASSVLDSELRFEAGQLGEIVARCNVVNPKDDGLSPGWSFLEVVYRDTDGPMLATQVRVSLKGVTNGGVNFTVAPFDSNNFPAVATTVNTIVFAHVFNFNANAYWVEIRIKRSNLVNNPAVFSVRLR